MFSVLSRRGAVAVCIVLSACAAGPGGVAGDPPSDRAYGDFLSARYAEAQHDPVRASQYYMQALRLEPGNAQLIDEGFLAALLAGSTEAERLATKVPANALADMLRGNQAAQNGDFAVAHHMFAQLPQDQIMGLIRPLLLAWTRFGQGDVQAALTELKPYYGNSAFSSVYVLNGALMADAAHDDAAAAQLYNQAASGGPINLRLAEILGSWHARQQQPELAAQDLATLIAAHPNLRIALPQLEAQLDKPVINTPTQGLAEAYLTLAGSLGGPSQSFLRITLLHFALMLRPDLTAARLLLASAQLGNPAATPKPAQLRNALATLQPVPPDDPLYGPVALQRAHLLAALKRPAEAVALLDTLSAAMPNDPGLLADAGDIWRNANQPAEALPYYNRALGLIGTPAPAAAWALYFDRGICEDELGDWAAAQRDITKALSLSPNQPYVLNYLGYSWALHGKHLDEARTMLQRAVALDPNDGAVLDSLGYVDLHLHRTHEAVAELTKAVELNPVDAEVNAHLGDAFWQAGQQLQANYQWQRALTLEPDAKLRAELEGKLHKYFSAK
ncbi:MAG TPA: tetratricopeptide repeat protein [Acidocella sp.]|nr:tetratricopeptide repeat protein [Acidocella sp.]